MSFKWFYCFTSLVGALFLGYGAQADSCKKMENGSFRVFDVPVSLGMTTIDTDRPLKKGDVIAQELLIIPDKAWQLQQALYDRSEAREILKAGDLITTISSFGQLKHCAVSNKVNVRFCFSDNHQEGSEDKAVSKTKLSIESAQFDLDEQSADVAPFRDTLGTNTTVSDLPLLTPVVGRRVYVTKAKKRYLELAVSGGTNFLTTKSSSLGEIRYSGKANKTRVDVNGSSEIVLAGLKLSFDEGQLTSVSGALEEPEIKLECDGTRVRFRKTTITANSGIR